VLAPLTAPGIWNNAIDVGERIDERTVRLSTAIVLSARFPVISTTAHFADTSGVLRLVDGGYVDNSGAVSAGQLLKALMEAAKRRGLANNLRPVILFLTNGDDRARARQESVLGRSILGVLVDPAVTLMGVSAGNAKRFRDDLTRDVEALHGKAIDFRL